MIYVSGFGLVDDEVSISMEIIVTCFDDDVSMIVTG
jgi:hypothetical protein